MYLKDQENRIDLGLLLLRIAAGGFMLYGHGIDKLMNYSTKVETFRDPIGLGPALSLQLVIFAEVLCASAVVVGFKTRLASIPLAFTMFVAVFIVKFDAPFKKQELGLMFLFMYLALILMGEGRFSLENLLKKRFQTQESAEEEDRT